MFAFFVWFFKSLVFRGSFLDFAADFSGSFAGFGITVIRPWVHCGGSHSSWAAEFWPVGRQLCFAKEPEKSAAKSKKEPRKTRDLKNQRNYRPITVSSCFLRVFEGALVNRIMRAMTRNLSETQGGFVQSRGTLEQLFAVREICWRNKREKKPLALALLDFQKH